MVSPTVLIHEFDPRSAELFEILNPRWLNCVLDYTGDHLTQASSTPSVRA